MGLDRAVPNSFRSTMIGMASGFDDRVDAALFRTDVPWFTMKCRQKGIVHLH